MVVRSLFYPDCGYSHYIESVFLRSKITCNPKHLPAKLAASFRSIQMQLLLDRVVEIWCHHIKFWERYSNVWTVSVHLWSSCSRTFAWSEHSFLKISKCCMMLDILRALISWVLWGQDANSIMMALLRTLWKGAQQSLVLSITRNHIVTIPNCWTIVVSKY